MIVLKLDKESSQPVYEQVYLQLRSLIDEGVIRDGEKLPSSRILAKQHGINRSTVYRAYEELWSLGYLMSRSGSYSYARCPSFKGKMNHLNSHKDIFNWETIICKSIKELSNGNVLAPANFEKPYIDFSVIAPDRKLMPVDAFRKCMNQVLIEDGSELLDYGDSQGFFPLRQFISNSMKKHGIATSPENLLITNGAQDGLRLFLQLFGKKDLKVVVESPVYEWAIRLFKAFDVEMVPIKMIYSGMDLDELELQMQKNKIDFIYTIPNFHNPTGISTSLAHRERLMELVNRYKVPLVEDGFEEEMKYFNKAVLPIKSIDSSQLVVYLGTFSKVLFPGLRVGWVVANTDCIKNLTALKKASEFASSGLNQAALERFCRMGYYERHLKKLHKTYKKRMQVFFKSATSYLNSNQVRVNRPIGGYSLWMQIKNSPKTEVELLNAFEEAGVALAPGSLYASEKTEELGFRISIARTNEEEIIEGVKRISSVLN